MMWFGTLFVDRDWKLIERAILGGVQTLYGTDLSREAIAITEKNVASAT